MGMSNIPLEDKQTVINNLAEGKSYSQVMEDTAIKSKDTIHRIAHQESNAIERKRKQFLEKIEQFGANESRRAMTWATMINATKKVGKNAVETPDWQARAVALKYIDTLAGLNVQEQPAVEVNNNFAPVQQNDLTSPEVTDFNKKFREFVLKGN